MRISKAAQTGLGVAIAAAGLWFFFRGVDAGQLLAELRSVSPWALIAAGSMSILSIGLRAVRWRLILPQPQSARTGDLFAITMIGFLVNNILPARAGEAARAVLLWRKCGCRPFVSIGSLVVERFIDILVFILFFFLPVFLLDSLKAPLVLRPAAALAGVFGISVLLITIYALFPRACRTGARTFVAAMPRRIRPRLATIGGEFVANLDWLYRPGRLVVVLILSFAMLLCHGAAIIILVGDWARFGVLQGMFTEAFAALGAAIPLAPGYVGTLHALMLQGLVLTGLTEDKARAMALLFHACGYVPVTLAGLYCYFRLDVRFKELSGAAEATRRASTTDFPAQSLD